MQRSTFGFAGAALLAVAGVAGAATPCRYSAPRQAEINAAGLQRLAVQIGPDQLTLRGEPGISKVMVTGTACASDPKWLPGVRIQASRQGAGAALVAHDGNRGVFETLFGSRYAYLKLDVRVPAALAIRLQQGSGNASIQGVGALDATLGSGDLTVGGVAGRFALRTGSGDVKASGVGSFELASLGSGDVVVDGIHGDAHVGSVDSGDLDLATIKGNLVLGSIGSGDVKVRGVTGSLRADSVGSGDLVAREVTGDIKVGSVGSGDVRIVDAGGDVRVDAVGSGDFGADGVAGDFSVGALGSGDLHHRNVKGKVEVPVRR